MIVAAQPSSRSHDIDCEPIAKGQSPTPEHAGSKCQCGLPRQCMLCRGTDTVVQELCLCLPGQAQLEAGHLHLCVDYRTRASLGLTKRQEAGPAGAYLQGVWREGLPAGRLGGLRGLAGGLRGAGGIPREQLWGLWGARQGTRSPAGSRCACASHTRPCLAAGRCS